MERLYINELIKWKNNRNKPLVVYGARQVGKTYLIKELFANKYFNHNYIYIDFKRDDDVRNFINGENGNGPTSNPKKIIEYISLRENKIIDKNTLLIFDEIQEAIPIITSLKYFKQDYNDIPIIASGSMVRIKLKRELKKNDKTKESFFFPVGAIDELNIYPVSFEEFLFNYSKILYDKINEAYYNKKPLDENAHQLALDVLYKYLLVGSMPENVEMFLNGKSIIDIRRNMFNLYNDYLNDMNLYQASSKSIIRTKLLFKNIYAQLNKESKNFRPSLIDKKYNTRDFKTPIEWLETAKIIYKSMQVKEIVTIPLMETDSSNFRIYIMDSGLLALQSDINMATFVDKNNRNTLSGVFFENYIACELASKNIPLFFWKGKNDAEFEFLINYNGIAVPIDVKKGKGSLNSIKKYKEHNSYIKSIKVSSNNYGYNENEKILTIPLYMFYALLNDYENNVRNVINNIN